MDVVCCSYEFLFLKCTVPYPDPCSNVGPAHCHPRASDLYAIQETVRVVSRFLFPSSSLSSSCPSACSPCPWLHYCQTPSPTPSATRSTSPAAQTHPESRSLAWLCRVMSRYRHRRLRWRLAPVLVSQLPPVAPLRCLCSGVPAVPAGSLRGCLHLPRRGAHRRPPSSAAGDRPSSRTPRQVAGRRPYPGTLDTQPR